ncbi:uncharacterized protein TNCV_5125041 [Trichonephila clavipes]|nr:uncharacterized protein TNCV_5125041 [Trichonephila clavipes]
MIRWVLKLEEFNIEWEHRSGTQNAVADVLSSNPVESVIGERYICAIIGDLVLSSREHLIEKQRKDPELGHIYRYLENPEDSSVNATICENWSRDFRFIEDLLFHAKNVGASRFNGPYGRQGCVLAWTVESNQGGRFDDQGERHTGEVDKRRPFIRSPPGSWSEPSRQLKRRRKENIGNKRSRESGSGGPERKIKKGLEHRVAKKMLSSNYNNDLPKFRKKGRTEETVMASTSGYNLRPRKGTRVESRPTIEMKTQQGGPVRARKILEKHYSPYIEEQARSGNKNTRRRGSQQQNCHERKGGANSNRSISLEVLVGDVNYES